MTVLNGDGLVGRVKTAGPSTATVLLAVDPDSSVGVRLEGSMEVGFTTGQGIDDDGALDLRLLDGQSTVAPGDRLVTFGSQGDTPYVPGVPVGVVRSVQGSPGLADPDRGRRALRRLHRPRPGRRGRRAAAQRPARRGAAASPRRRTPQPTVTVTVDAGHGARRLSGPRVARWPPCLVVVALALQVTLLSRLPLPGATPDLVLLVVVATRARRRPRRRPAHRLRGRAGPDLVPPADHEVGRWALVLTVVGYLAGLAQAETRRSAFVPLAVVAAAAAAGRSCCTPGSAPCSTTRNVTWSRREPSCCRPRSSTTWC